MAGLRTLVLKWDITTGKLKCSSCYLKREERIDVELYVTEYGEPVALASNWGLNLTLKPQGEGDNAALVAITSWSASATTGTYTASAQAISSSDLDAWLLVNDDTSDDVESKYGDIDLYYTISAAMKAKSDTLTVTVKPDVGRADDGTPITTAVSITASGYTMSTARLLGRTTASTGAIEEITVGSGLTLSSGSLTATGAADASESYTFTRKVDAYVNFVFEGDSLTAGTVLNAGEDYPTACMLLPGFSAGNKYNVADGGNTIAAIATQYTAQVYPRRPTGSIESAWLFLWVGTNDVIYQTGYYGTSVTSISIATGAGKSMTISTGLSFTAGHKIRVTNNNVNGFNGTVTSYDSGTGALVFTADSVVGSGTYASWNIYVGNDETAGVSTILSGIQSYIKTAKDDGFKVVMITPMMYSDPYYFYRAKYNALIDGIYKMSAGASTKTYDYLVDAATIFQDHSVWGTGDYIHLSYAANQALAKLLNEIVMVDGKPLSPTGFPGMRFPNPLILSGVGSTQQVIHLNTSEGTDNGSLFIAASGQQTNSEFRGAWHWMFGANTSAVPGWHIFGVGPTGGYLFKNGADTELMRLTNAGELGIGTATPSTPLHVVGAITSISTASASFPGGVIATDTFASDGHGVALVRNGWVTVGAVKEAGAAVGMSFRTDRVGAAATGGTERMRITHGGGIILPAVLAQTTDPGVAGQLWNNGGVLMISAG